MKYCKARKIENISCVLRVLCPVDFLLMFCPQSNAFRITVNSCYQNIGFFDVLLETRLVSVPMYHLLAYNTQDMNSVHIDLFANASNIINI